MGDRPRGEAFVQAVFDEDRGRVPQALRDASFVDPGRIDLPPSCYTSREYHDLEMDRMWSRVWQMACREEDIPGIGDYHVYEVGDTSLIVVRAAADRIRAFHNSCLHRGTQLRTGSGSSTELRCNYHGFTWDLDGALCRVPCAWDFPDLDPDAMRLPEARVGTWGGFVFVNPDPAAGPLEEHLEILPDHFAEWPLEDRYKSAHVVRVAACNWKIALEAFIEAYHVVGLHPQLLKTVSDTMTEYDIWPESRHISRMITTVGEPSEHLSEASVQVRPARPGRSEKPLPSRHELADQVRQRVARRAEREIAMSDAEAVDGTEYFAFPNLMPWLSYTTPLVYRFRPNGNDPDSSLVDVMLLEPIPESGRPPAAKPRVLEPGETFLDTPELGFLSTVLNQDFATLPRVQRGLKASVASSLQLGHYQEARIRHFHATLRAYLES